MPSPFGLIPAAGRATRLGTEEGSKEIFPLASEQDHRPVIDYLLDAMGVAEIGRAFVVLRDGKWDIPAKLARRDGTTGPQLAYLVTRGTRSIPETVDVAYSFVRDAEVVLGFPDVRFEPRQAVVDLVSMHRQSGADIVLALFPSDRPDKTDMVDTDGPLITGFRVKPGPCELTHTWILAVWGPRFTRFLHDYLASVSSGQNDLNGPELQMSEVFAAALTDNLSIGAHVVENGRFIDIGTPDDLKRAADATELKRLFDGGSD